MLAENKYSTSWFKYIYSDDEDEDEDEETFQGRIDLFRAARDADDVACRDRRPGSLAARVLAAGGLPLSTSAKPGASSFIPNRFDFRTTMAHGVPIRLDLPTAGVPPSPEHLNPLTGEHWTNEDLAQWPNGYPGLELTVPNPKVRDYVPSRLGFSLVPVLESKTRGKRRKGKGKFRADPPLPQRTAEPSPQVLAKLKVPSPPMHIITRNQLPEQYRSLPDHSEEDLQIFWAANIVAYRWPHNKEELEVLVAARNEPGNLMAYNMVQQWRALAHTIPEDKRTIEDTLILTHQWQRPHWIPPRKPEPPLRRNPAGRAHQTRY